MDLGMLKEEFFDSLFEGVLGDDSLEGGEEGFVF